MNYILKVAATFFVLGCVSLGMPNSLVAQGSVDKDHFQPRDQVQSQIDIKEKHTLIYESLKDVYSDYTTDYMKALAFLIICIGWFITSDKSRNFFKENRTIRISAAIALTLVCIIHVRSQISTYVYSQNIFSDLLHLDYVDAKFYENYKITLEQLITNSIMNTVLFAVLILIVLSLGKVIKKS